MASTRQASANGGLLGTKDELAGRLMYEARAAQRHVERLRGLRFD